MNKEQESIEDLKRRKKIFRQHLQNLSATEKIEQLLVLQEHYYELLSIREQNGGFPIPEKWRKWYQARFGNT
jgi:tRNA A22 N-methylase